MGFTCGFILGLLFFSTMDAYMMCRLNVDVFVSSSITLNVTLSTPSLCGISAALDPTLAKFGCLRFRVVSVVSFHSLMSPSDAHIYAAMTSLSSHPMTLSCGHFTTILLYILLKIQIPYDLNIIFIDNCADYRLCTNASL